MRRPTWPLVLSLAMLFTATLAGVLFVLREDREEIANLEIIGPAMEVSRLAESRFEVDWEQWHEDKGDGVLSLVFPDSGYARGASLDGEAVLLRLRIWGASRDGSPANACLRSGDGSNGPIDATITLWDPDPWLGLDPTSHSAALIEGLGLEPAIAGPGDEFVLGTVQLSGAAPDVIHVAIVEPAKELASLVSALRLSGQNDTDLRILLGVGELVDRVLLLATLSVTLSVALWAFARHRRRLAPTLPRG